MSETKKRILGLVERINGNPLRVERGIPPLEYDDQGWRIVFDKYLEDFTFCRAGRKLMEMAIADSDFQGIYYWIPITDPPRGVTTPASRLIALNQGD